MQSAGVVEGEWTGNATSAAAAVKGVVPQNPLCFGGRCSLRPTRNVKEQTSSSRIISNTLKSRWIELATAKVFELRDRRH